jgi:hypothetical protein
MIPAVVVPYKNRPRYLELLLKEVPRYLEAVNGIADFTIFVAEQTSAGLFNVALSRNVGAAFALQEERYDYFVFHNVDIIPVRNVDYRMPAHNVAWFLDAGSCKVHRDALREANGYDPRYVGWGSEDTDFYDRLSATGCDVRLWHETDESKGAVSWNLEMPPLSDDQALAWSMRYFGLRLPGGPRFLPFRGRDGAFPFAQHDKNDFLVPDQRRKNEERYQTFHALSLDDKRTELRRVGLADVRLSAVTVKKREPRLVWLTYDAGAVNATPEPGGPGRP